MSSGVCVYKHLSRRSFRNVSTWPLPDWNVVRTELYLSVESPTCSEISLSVTVCDRTVSDEIASKCSFHAGYVCRSY